MTAWLIRLFVPNRDQVADPGVRAAYGTLASITGIIVNVLLAAAKFLIGVFSGSLAITADAVNNLSDAAGSVMTLVSVRVANKPVDTEHPFGHGRMEYIGSLGVGALIVFMGLSLLRDGITAILHPEALSVSWVMLAVLVLSVLGKLWLYFFYRKTGGAVNNGTLLAAAKDSLGDVLATSAVILGTLLNWLLGWKLDGPMGIIVALIVLKAGLEVCRDTLDSLLGGKPDPEKIQQIRELLLSREGILGLHDLVLHDYGPGRCVASVHAEVSAEDDILTIHEMIDDAEREIGEKMHMPICIHMDPIITRDETTNRVRQQFGDFLTAFDASLSLHDFRMVPGEGHTNLIFDCVLPAGYVNKEALMKALTAFARSIDERYRLVVQFDTDYT
ncbi:MAG: cation transporter [Clostridia bacterium]|nr:cation transporter [Clostridia bacterium]